MITTRHYTHPKSPGVLPSKCAGGSELGYHIMGLCLAHTDTRLAVLRANTAGLAITGRPVNAQCSKAEAMITFDENFSSRHQKSTCTTLCSTG